MVYRGQIYYCHSEAQRQRFMADPDRYLPAYAGNDPVLTTDQRQAIPGKVAHVMLYRDRFYFFASQNTLEQFRDNPERYAEANGREDRD